MIQTVTQYIQAHGGVIATFVMVLAAYNILMSAIAALCAKLSIQEPAWMQNAGAWGLKLSQWLSANTPTPASQAPQSQTTPPSS